MEDTQQDVIQNVSQEETVPKKYGQPSITDFKNVKVLSSDTNHDSDFDPLYDYSSISRRRSNRVIPKRKVESDEEAEHLRKKRPYKKKIVVKAKKAKSTETASKDKKKATTTTITTATANKPDASSTSTEDAAKKTVKKQEPLKKKPSVKTPPKDLAETKDQPKLPVKLAPKPVPKPSLSLSVNPILLSDWAPQVPLSASDFKTQSSVVSRLKFPHMKSVPYAKDLIFVMSFINKFHKFLPQEVWSLSIQDLEIGLDLYPLPFDGEQTESEYYANYIAAKEVRRCQDVSNLLFVSLMKLTLNHKSQTSLKSLQSSTKPYAKLISELRSKAVEFGYPKEWKVASSLAENQSNLFEKDDTEPVDPNNPEILTPNIVKWTEQLIVPLEEDPLHDSELERLGLLALSPNNRVVFLRSLAQWCIANSDIIHGEIYRLSHLRKDPSFGIKTHQAPRHLVQGIEAAHQHFKKLCNLVKERMELRRSKKHVKKQLESGKRQDLTAKYQLLDELKKNLKQYRQEHNQTTTDKKKNFDALAVSIERDYPKWSKLIFEEINDHEPLENPYEDEVYKLRCLEFFISRVPYVGDFYLPRLFTYQSAKTKTSIPTNYCDPITLVKTLQDFENGNITPFELFGKNGKLNSLQFKIYYYDTPGMVHDLMSSTGTSSSKNYWYEMCHDSSSLKDFIRLLEFKIFKDEENKKKKKSNNNETAFTAADNKTNLTDDKTHNELESEDTKPELDDVNTNPESKLEPIEGFNCNPLPKEYKYNKSRSKFLIFKEYLEKMLYLLQTFEQLKVEYGDMSTTDRNLRRSQRTKVSYTEEVPESSESEDIEEEAVYAYGDQDDGGDDYEDQSDIEVDDVEEEYRDESDTDERRKPGRPPKKKSKVFKVKT